jgi:hypothetical protein
VISGIRVTARVALLAATLAVLVFGAAGYGAFGPLQGTNAILETTSQAPVSVLPHPSPGIVATGPASTSRPYDRTPLIAVIFVGGMVVVVVLIRRRTARA